jgi:HlyD family secretion protein
VGIQEQLAAQGLLTRQTLLLTTQQRDAAREKLRSDSAQLAQLDITELQARIRLEQDQRAEQARLTAAASRLSQLTLELRTQGEVVSPYTGRILEIMAEQGGLVARGEALLTLDLTGRAVKDLEAVLYVASTQGKKIRPGMRIHIAPSTVKPEEHGYVVGRVTYVSDFPASASGMMRTLKNQALAQSLSGGDAPYEVHADLLVDPTTVSKYRWTSSEGPPAQIQSGTLCVGDITVAEQRPIQLVIPLVRKYTRL